MDEITNILHAMRLTGGIFLDADFTAPWCVSAKIGPDDCGQFVPVPRSVIAFHYVDTGELRLQIHGEPPLAVQAGEIVVLPRNDDHLLGSRLDLESVSADDLIQPGAGGRLPHIHHGGGGELTRIVCGFLGTDRHNDPVLQMLPRVIKLKAEDGISATWIESSFRFAARETAAGLDRMPDVLTRLAELLFADAVRRYLSTLPRDQRRWCAGMPDSKIAQALGFLHGQMNRRWTTEQLGREVGLSRSALAERFSRTMGEAPMRYLARQRLQTASRRLRETTDSVARVAYDAGYESEAAFSRAFKREFGMPPATWRSRQST